MATSGVTIPKIKFLTFILSLFLLSGPPIAEASHSLSIEVDKPGGIYISGKDAITFTVTNNGNDDAHVACDYPMQAYTNPQGGQQNGVAQEQINSCYVLQGLPGGSILVAYKLSPGDTRTWQWNQKDFGGAQVADGPYVGKISTDENSQTHAIAHTVQTSNFNIEKDSDGDGVVDSQDACPKTFGTGTKNKAVGCPDIDDDGIPDQMDDGSHPDKCVPHTAAPFPPEQYAEDENGYLDKDGCPDEIERVQVRKASATIMYGMLFTMSDIATKLGFINLEFPWIAAGLFVMEAIDEIAAHHFWEIATDPPDKINYETLFIPKPPSEFTAKTISSTEPEMQTLLNNAFELSATTDAVQKSIDRYNGALAVSDYKAALKQAKAARIYSAQASEASKAFATSVETFTLEPFFENLTLEQIKKSARQLRKNLLANGTYAIPELERNLLTAESREDLLPKIYADLTNETKIETMTLPKEQFLVTASQARKAGQVFYFDSKTFGSNIYLTQSHDNKTAGIYYQNAPNNARWFIIGVNMPAEMKFIELIKTNELKGWLMFTFKNKSKINIIGINLFGKPIKTGTNGFLFDLEFENLVQTNNKFEITRVSGNTMGWLIRQNAPIPNQ